MRHLCPACRRINDHYPAGELLLFGDFIGAHKDEMLATIRHVADAERAEHPLNRIISIDEDDDMLVVSTTDIHLPHRIAHAIKDAWGGTTATRCDLGSYFTRVLWQRDV